MRLQDALMGAGQARAASPDILQAPRLRRRPGQVRPPSPSNLSPHPHQQQRRPYQSELASGLRRYLHLAAVGPVHDSSRLQAALQQHLPLEDSSFQQIWDSCAPWRTLALKDDLECVHSSVDRMLQLFTPQELSQLLVGHPDLLTSGLPGWLDFFESYGFSEQQIKNIIVASPSVLTGGSVATAGLAILRLKALGFDDDEVRHRVVPFCPQVLAMEQDDIDTLIRLWSKFRTGVDESQ